ncbi:hypothetical protein GTX14_24290 [Streptomyces sp. SID4944]|nr:hypothetical protein [Streptomyces sp. SID4944]
MHRLLQATLATAALAGVLLLLLLPARAADNLLVALALAALGGGASMAWFRFPLGPVPGPRPEGRRPRMRVGPSGSVLFVGLPAVGGVLALLLKGAGARTWM